MFKKFAKLLGAIALTGWVGVANASLIFDFSWGGPNVETMGEIRGLSNKLGDQVASSVIITKLGGIDVYFEFTKDDVVQANYHKFVIQDSVIVFAHFTALIYDQIYFGNTPTDMHILLTDDFHGYFGNVRTRVEEGVRGPTFPSPRRYSGGVIRWGEAVIVARQFTVPEPGTIILLSLGLAGLSFARYRKQS
jgi:hypothetical protein